MSFVTTTTQSNSLLAANLNASAARLAAGKRITQASDDIAGLAAGTALNNEVVNLRAQISNISQGSSLLQVADGGLQQQSAILDRLKSLSVQASSGGIDDTTRAQLNQEFQGLTQELDRISGTTNFNGVQLLDGSLNTTIGGTGSDALPVTLGNTNSATLFAGASIDITTQTNAQTASDAIDVAITSLASQRASVGSYESQFNAQGAALQSSYVNQSAAASSLLDTDVAAESSNFAQLLTQQKAAISVQAQTNKLSSGFLKLLQ